MVIPVAVLQFFRGDLTILQNMIDDGLGTLGCDGTAKFHKLLGKVLFSHAKRSKEGSLSDLFTACLDGKGSQLLSQCRRQIKGFHRLIMAAQQGGLGGPSGIDFDVGQSQVGWERFTITFITGPAIVANGIAEAMGYRYPCKKFRSYFPTL